MNTGSMISVKNLCRNYGALQAVDDVSFEVEAGQVTGFIGENGAGKTTTMRVMATLDHPSAGSVTIGGYDAVHERSKAKELVGWMPDAYGAYDNLTVYEYLDFFARALGYRGQEVKKRVSEVIEFTELTPLVDRETTALSKGMGQRLCLGRMLISDPQVLILDEPAAGLDPKARVEFKRLIRLLAQHKKSIFISSHILTELEDMCDTILFISKGRLVHHGSAAALKADTDGKTLVRVQVIGEPDSLIEWTRMQPGVTIDDTFKNGVVLQLEGQSPQEVSDVLRRLISAGIPVTDFHRTERRLEDAFIDLLEKSGAKPK